MAKPNKTQTGGGAKVPKTLNGDAKLNGVPKLWGGRGRAGSGLEVSSCPRVHLCEGDTVLQGNLWTRNLDLNLRLNIL